MESSAGRVGPAGAKSGVVCWSCDWWAQRMESSAGLVGLVGASSGVVCWL